MPVVEQGNRLNFPTQHPTTLTEIAEEVLARADVIPALAKRASSSPI